MHEHIVMEIKYLIEKGVLKYGDKLPTELELASEFGVSRATVREAFLILDFLGLIETKKGRGAIVCRPSTNGIMEKMESFRSASDGNILHLVELRLAVEPLAAMLAAERATAEDMAKIDDAVTKMIKKTEGQRPFLIDAIAFHQLIGSASHNPYVEYLLDSIIRLLRSSTKVIYSVPGRTQESLSEHMAIYRAIKDRDKEKAFNLMRAHLEAVKSVLQTIYGAS